VNIRPLPALTSLVWLVTACSHKPPADFAPDPGLVARIVEIQMTTAAAYACPGQGIRADYEAVLDDGTVVPFARTYDKDRPPPLHVVFLDRRSEEAASQEDGDWSTDPDPLRSAVDGFRLHASLRARPELSASATVAPEYSCLGTRFSSPARPAGTGPLASPVPTCWSDWGSCARPSTSGSWCSVSRWETLRRSTCSRMPMPCPPPTGSSCSRLEAKADEARGDRRERPEPRGRTGAPAHVGGRVVQADPAGPGDPVARAGRLR
jgi:hypothetical protein